MVQTETPVQGLSLWDRPDDGGQTLLANWTLVHDDDFARYLVYLNEGPWSSQPTAIDLQPRAADASVSLHSRLQTEISTIDGQPLQDGVEYWAVVVVEYNDGRFGTPSARSDQQLLATKFQLLQNGRLQFLEAML